MLASWALLAIVGMICAWIAREEPCCWTYTLSGMAEVEVVVVVVVLAEFAFTC